MDELGAQLVLHVLAWKPLAVTEEELKAQTAQTAASAEGEEGEERLEPVLMKQAFLLDDKKSVAQVLQRFGKERLNGIDVSVRRFARWELGEGSVRVESDIAADVQKMLEKK